MPATSSRIISGTTIRGKTSPCFSLLRLPATMAATAVATTVTAAAAALLLLSGSPARPATKAAPPASLQPTSPEAQLFLGASYAEGRGVVQDDVKAVHWFRKAAAQGLPDAQFFLAGMYALGRGVAPDLVKAFALFDAAEKNGLKEAGPVRNALSRQLTAYEVGEGLRRSRALQQPGHALRF